MLFKEEQPTHEFYMELIPLLVCHHKEIGQYHHDHLEPDFPMYTLMNESGLVKFFTVRDDKDTLCGYSIFFINKCMHHKYFKKAVQDAVYILPECRGTGHHFMRFCENQLKEAGVDVIYIAYNHKMNLSPILTRLGYEECEVVYSKKIGRDNHGTSSDSNDHGRDRSSTSESGPSSEQPAEEIGRSKHAQAG